MATQTLPKRKVVTFAMRFQVFMHAVLFVLGMSTIIVFVFGGATTILGRVLYDARDWITRIGGIVVIIFGLHTLGIIKIPFLNYDTRKQYSGSTSFGSSYLMGIFFTAGWTPCIGVTLGAIMTMGLAQEQAGTAMILAAAYALGLGLPFLIMGLLIDRATNILRRLRKYIRTFEIVTGVFLILLGIMLLDGQMTQFAAVASPIRPAGRYQRSGDRRSDHPDRFFRGPVVVPVAVRAAVGSGLSRLPGRPRGESSRGGNPRLRRR